MSDCLWLQLHVGSVAALPRDVTAAADGNMCLAFVPELATLRENGSHVHMTNVNSNMTNFTSGRQLEIKAVFAPDAKTTIGLSVLARAARPPAPKANNCTDPFVPCYGWDRGGDDLGCSMNYSDSSGTVEQCEAKCLANAKCLAWSWCGVGSIGPGPRCCLKSFVPNTVAAFTHMACGIAPRAKGHIPAGAMDFSGGAAATGGTSIFYDPRVHTLSVSTHNNPGHDSTPLTLRPSEPLSLHVFVGAQACRMVLLMICF